MRRRNKTMAQVKVHLLLVLSLLILAMVAESRTIGGINAVAETAGSSTVKGEEEAKTVVCNSVHGAEDGDTCISVAKKVSLSTEEFLEINPNIDCEAIFVGQWLCVGGFTFL